MLQTKPATFTATKASGTPWCVQMRWPGTTQRNHALVQVCVVISEVLGKKGAINADTSSSVVLDPLRSFSSRCHKILWSFPLQSTLVTLRPSQCWLMYNPLANKRESQHWGRSKEVRRGVKLDKLVEKAWHEKSSVSIQFFKEIWWVL